jgi:hypothetical protein
VGCEDRNGLRLDPHILPCRRKSQIELIYIHRSRVSSFKIPVMILSFWAVHVGALCFGHPEAHIHTTVRSRPCWRSTMSYLGTMAPFCAPFLLYLASRELWCVIRSLCLSTSCYSSAAHAIDICVGVQDLYPNTDTTSAPESRLCVRRLLARITEASEHAGD